MLFLIKSCVAVVLLGCGSAFGFVPYTPPSLAHLPRDAPIGKTSKINLLATKGPANPLQIPASPQFQSTVKPLIDKISTEEQWNWLVKLTQFPERYYKSDNGAKAADWVCFAIIPRYVH